MLYHADGSRAVVTDFQPLKTELTSRMTKSFVSYGGRSSDGVLPFFNLKQPDGDGAITAVGWSGQWTASFTRDDDYNVNFREVTEDEDGLGKSPVFSQMELKRSKKRKSTVQVVSRPYW